MINSIPGWGRVGDNRNMSDKNKAGVTENGKRLLEVFSLVVTKTLHSDRSRRSSSVESPAHTDHWDHHQPSHSANIYEGLNAAFPN